MTFAVLSECHCPVTSVPTALSHFQLQGYEIHMYQNQNNRLGRAPLLHPKLGLTLRIAGAVLVIVGIALMSIPPPRDPLTNEQKQMVSFMAKSVRRERFKPQIKEIEIQCHLLREYTLNKPGISSDEAIQQIQQM